MKEKLKCPICGSTKSEKFWAMNGYRLARCMNCTMVWDPLPSENVLSQYEKSYFINENPKGGYTNYFEGMRINKKTFYERLKRAKEKVGRGKLLDVGCALGDCLLEAKKLGFKDSVGLEVSKFAASKARSKGLNVKQGVLNDSTFPKESFDLVTYQDVIEHIEDPLDELKKVHKVLQKRGYVFLVTPDIGGWWLKLLGSNWYHYKPGEHIMYFTQKSLRKALEKTGFNNIETRKTYHVLSLEYVFNRLKYYSPVVFGAFLNLVKTLGIKDFSFKAYTGEIEAWGQKT